MRIRRIASLGAGFATLALWLAGCSGGGSSPDASTSPGFGISDIVDVDSSLPLHGPSRVHAAAIESGIRLALAQAHNRAGNFRVNYESLDDSTMQSTRWDRRQTAANARRAAVDTRAVYYIGEFDSAASAVSIPILNEAGIAEVSPASTYVGLTTGGAGSTPGEPQEYYPRGQRTFLRIVPRDTIQAAAALLTMKRNGCTKVALAHDKGAYGASLAALLELEKGKYGVNIVSNTGVDPTHPNFRSYARTIKGQGATCFYFAGIVSPAAVQITKEVTAALPNAKIYGGSGVCTSSYTVASHHGVPASIDPKIQCLAATLDLAAYPGGKKFLQAYKTAYGASNPDPYAIYGYEAMSLALDTIARLGSNGNDKDAVLAALFATKDRHSALGTYGFDSNGDTTLKSYGLYRVGKDGTPQFEGTVTP